MPVPAEDSSSNSDSVLRSKAMFSIPLVGVLTGGREQVVRVRGQGQVQESGSGVRIRGQRFRGQVQESVSGLGVRFSVWPVHRSSCMVILTLPCQVQGVRFRGQVQGSGSGVRFRSQNQWSGSECGPSIALAVWSF